MVANDWWLCLFLEQRGLFHKIFYSLCIIIIIIASSVQSVKVEVCVCITVHGPGLNPFSPIIDMDTPHALVGLRCFLQILALVLQLLSIHLLRLP